MAKRSSSVRLKRTAIKMFAVFFVVYALAEVSVLQAYCGNESLGIPPASHFKSQKRVGDERKITTQVTSDVSGKQASSDADADRNIPCDGDEECLGGCAHIILTTNLISFHTSIGLVSSQLNVSRYDRHVTSDLAPLFHPPKSV